MEGRGKGRGVFYRIGVNCRIWTKISTTPAGSCITDSLSHTTYVETKNVLRSIQQMFTLPKEVNTKLTSCSHLGFGDSKQKSTQGNVNPGCACFWNFFIYGTSFKLFKA